MQEIEFSFVECDRTAAQRHWSSHNCIICIIYVERAQKLNDTSSFKLSWRKIDIHVQNVCGRMQRLCGCAIRSERAFLRFINFEWKRKTRKVLSKTPLEENHADSWRIHRMTLINQICADKKNGNIETTGRRHLFRYLSVLFLVADQIEQKQHTSSVHEI